MLYTLAKGSERYNPRLHYSLYGGVEEPANRVKALKELLPLIAIPAVAIALLVAIINFHIPGLSPGSGSNNSGGNSTLTRSSSPAGSLILGTGSPSGNTGSGSTGTTSAVSRAPATPTVQDTVNGVTGGMGGDETIKPPAATPPAATDTAKSVIGTVNPNATVTTNGTTTTVSGSATVPGTGTPIDVNKSIDP